MTNILTVLSKGGFVDNVKVKQLVCFPDFSAVIHKECIVRNSTLAFDPFLHTYKYMKVKTDILCFLYIFHLKLS